MPFSSTTEVLRTTEAPSRSTGASFCTAKNAPFVLMPIVSSKKASDTSAKATNFAMPAFTNKKSTAPSSVFAFNASTSRSKSFDVSDTRPIAFGPSSFCALSTASFVRAVKTLLWE